MLAMAEGSPISCREVTVATGGQPTLRLSRDYAFLGSQSLDDTSAPPWE